MFRTFAFASCLLAGTIVQAGAVENDARAKLEVLTADAERLSREQISILGAATGEAGGAELNQRAATWQDNERAFQAGIQPLLSTRSYPDDLREVSDRLATFDNLAFSAMADLYDCRLSSAKARMQAAAGEAQHARMALDGCPDPDWSSETDSAAQTGATDCAFQSRPQVIAVTPPDQKLGWYLALIRQAGDVTVNQSPMSDAGCHAQLAFALKAGSHASCVEIK